MTPFEFADQYHFLQVEDDRLGLSVTLNISKYKADWAQEDVAEASAVLDAVARKFLGLRGASAVPQVFQVTGSRLADPDEKFCCAGIRRAFCSRGSPSEISDALRIAVLVGRNGNLSPKQYAEKWFGQDCNAFAGNWLGLSPMLPIMAYPTGTGLGTTSSEQDCRTFLPLLARADTAADLWGIAQGDVLVTYGEPDKRNNPWRHVGIVQGVDGGMSSARLSIAEWGAAGGRTAHNNGPYTVSLIPDLLEWRPAKGWETLHAALKRTLPRRKLIGYQGSAPGGKKAFRIFLDPGATASLDTRGWHSGNFQFGH
jgi:hypothetical protein